MFDLQFSSSMQDSCNNATNRFFLARSVLVMLRVFSSIYEAIGVLSSKFSDHPSWLGCQKVIEKHLENTMDLIMGNWRASPSGFLSTKKRVIFEKLRVRKKKKTHLPKIDYQERFIIQLKPKTVSNSRNSIRTAKVAVKRCWSPKSSLEQRHSLSHHPVACGMGMGR